MDWCYTAQQIVVLLLEGLEGKFIMGDLGAAMIVCSMEPRCTDSILIREKQAQPLELCTKIKMGRGVISHPPAASEDGSEGSEAACDIPVGSPVEEIERCHIFCIGKFARIAERSKFVEWSEQAFGSRAD